MILVIECGLAVALVCRLFGHCRQAFYQSKADIESEVAHERRVIEAVRAIRDEDPGIGGYKLWLMLIDMFGRSFVPGRDRFFVLLRRKGLMLPKPKPRHTTDSNHRYHKYKNLIKDIVPSAANQLWVADITYISLAGGDVCYLHLITDAYSHKIVGWSLAPLRPRCAVLLRCLRGHAQGAWNQHLNVRGLQADGQRRCRAGQWYNKGGKCLPAEVLRLV